jgi:hypothetical protein
MHKHPADRTAAAPEFFVAERAIPALGIRPGYKLTLMGDTAVVFYEIRASDLHAHAAAEALRQVRS